MIKCILALVLLSSCSTHKMMVVDTSYLEGCQNGAYATYVGIKSSMGNAAAGLEINPIVIATICQSMYLESLKVKNPQYKQIELDDQSLPRI